MLPVVMGPAEHLRQLGVEVSARVNTAAFNLVDIERAPAPHLRYSADGLTLVPGSPHRFLTDLLPGGGLVATLLRHRFDAGAPVERLALR